MNVTMKLKLGEYQLVELRRLAADRGVDVADIVGGIVTLYLNGKVKKPKRDERNENFIAIVREAVRVYEGGGALAADAQAVFDEKYKMPLGTLSVKGKRLGRPPKMSDDEVRQAVAMRGRGMTFPSIGVALGHSDYVIRNTLSRSPRGRAVA